MGDYLFDKAILRIIYSRAYTFIYSIRSINTFSTKRCYNDSCRANRRITLNYCIMLEAYYDLFYQIHMGAAVVFFIGFLFILLYEKRLNKGYEDFISRDAQYSYNPATWKNHVVKNQKKILFWLAVLIYCILIQTVMTVLYEKPIIAIVNLVALFLWYNARENKALGYDRVNISADYLIKSTYNL